ncbi:MAG: hypothetical protein E7426_06220 [Ruminococcaceae bacterium]|nr:hypothetical protein [Oscillospiraceae bacterium]
MYGYLIRGGEGRPEAELHPLHLGGVNFLALETRGSGRRLDRRVRRALLEMERRAIRRCVMPTDWPAAWRGRFHPVEERQLRQALLPQLLERFCAQRQICPGISTALLSAPRADAAVWQAAELLSRRCRYVLLDVPEAEKLSSALRHRYGVAAGHGGFPALQVCFGNPAEGIPAVLLGPDCARRQTVCYELPPLRRAALDPYPVSPQLVAALWAAGALPTAEIGVHTLGSGA